ncbi:unnamed protein product [Clavelina lepadiformis]|uniref:Uncharacterized protein n=1 Tax=Clavelina lepadiformis TaxID=159417 RepID=A0ABP0FI70_CLALP
MARITKTYEEIHNYGARNAASQGNVAQLSSHMIDFNRRGIAKACDRGVRPDSWSNRHYPSLPSSIFRSGGTV